MATASSQTVAPSTVPTAPFLPALILLFVGSGAAALIYEVVWFQMLSLSLGSSAISRGSKGQRGNSAFAIRATG